MKTTIKFLIFFLILIMYCSCDIGKTDISQNELPQLNTRSAKVRPVQVELSIENQRTARDGVYFDIYMKTMPGSEDLFLTISDFILSFNEENFRFPELIKVQNPKPVIESMNNGYCTFTSSLYREQNSKPSYYVQSIYFESTATSIIDDDLVINLNGPLPANQSSIESIVAKIDGNPMKHRLGRFKLTGLINPGRPAGIAWKVDKSGLKTNVNTVDPNPPFYASETMVSYKKSWPAQQGENDILAELKARK